MVREVESKKKIIAKFLSKLVNVLQILFRTPLVVSPRRK